MPPHRDEQGFILAGAILALMIVGSAVTAGYFIANQEYHIGKSYRGSVRAFYAAQAGLQEQWARWSIRDRWSMKGGDSIPIGPVALANGAAYRGHVLRVDNTPRSDTDTERYYVLRIIGLTRAAFSGEEVRNGQTLTLRVRYYDFCCTGALTAKDTTKLAGNVLIDGNNHDPVPWGAQCDSAGKAPYPGLEVQCPTCWYDAGSNVKTEGSPPVEVDTTLKAKSLLEWDEVTWDFLTSRAEKVYPPGADAKTIAPVVSIDPSNGLPTCNAGVLNNWGEPMNAAHPCFNYFPIIYAQGSLHISSGDYGQGILLVEGDLKLSGGFSFYGIVVVRGHLETTGQAGKIWGSAVVAGQNTGALDENKIAGAATIRYSSCAIMRAKRLAELAKKEPLTLRPWTEETL